MTPRTKKCFISFGCSLLHSVTQTKFRKASSLNFTLTSDCWGRVGGVGGEGEGYQCWTE